MLHWAEGKYSATSDPKDGLTCLTTQRKTVRDSKSVLGDIGLLAKGLLFYNLRAKDAPPSKHFGAI